MVLTNIERQKHRADRVSLFIDGRFMIGLHRETFLKCGLHKGDTITRDALNTLLATEEFIQTKQSALRLLSYRMRTEKEVRARLLEKEFHPETIDRVVEELRRLELIDDQKFARAFVHDTQLRRPTGRRLLQQQLKLRGISPTIIRNVLADHTDTESELHSALQAARRALKRYRNSSNDKSAREKQRYRLAQLLVRRGFDWSTISSVLKRLFPTDTPPLQEL